MTLRTRVGINGYCVIDERVAHAVTPHDDMDLVGVEARLNTLQRHAFEYFLRETNFSKKE